MTQPPPPPNQPPQRRFGHPGPAAGSARSAPRRPPAAGPLRTRRSRRRPPSPRRRLRSSRATATRRRRRRPRRRPSPRRPRRQSPATATRRRPRPAARPARPARLPWPARPSQPGTAAAIRASSRSRLPAAAVHAAAAAAPRQAGGKKLNTQVPIIIAAVVAIALIVGGGVWYASSGEDATTRRTRPERRPAADTERHDGGGNGGDDGGGSGPDKEKAPANTSSKVLFQLPAPAVGQATIDQRQGLLAHRQGLRQARHRRDRRLRPGQGQPSLDAPLPGQICAASPRTSPRTQRRRSSSRPPSARPTTNRQPLHRGRRDRPGRPASSCGRKTRRVRRREVDVRRGHASAATRSPRAAPTAAPPSTSTPASRCGRRRSATAATTPATAAASSSSRSASAATYDSRAAHIQTTRPEVRASVHLGVQAALGHRVRQLVSTKPLVVGRRRRRHAGDGAASRTSSRSTTRPASCAPRSRHPGDKYDGECDGVTEVEACRGIAVGNGSCTCRPRSTRAPASTARPTRSSPSTWPPASPPADRADAGDGYTMFPLRMDGGNIIAYKRPPVRQGRPGRQHRRRDLQADHAAGEPGRRRRCATR